MAVDKKGIITYVELLKEDLCIFRVVPDDGVIPDYQTGQFLTLGMPIPSENNKTVRRASVSYTHLRAHET